MGAWVAFDRPAIPLFHSRPAPRLAHVLIPTLRFILCGPFSAVDLAAGGQRHLALIGRTFLQKFTMIYEGRTGTVTLSNDP
jgi:hypothetical protein